MSTEDGFLAVGSVEATHDDPVLWHSATGENWSIVHTDGLDGPADVSSLTSHGDVLWAGGVYRNSDDPGSGPFRMAVWRSTDGTTWEAVDTVTDPGESWINHLSATSSGLFMVGGLDGESGSWQSTDGALTWTAIPGDASLSQVVERDGTLVGAGRTGEAAGQDPALLISVDQGATWATTKVTTQLGGMNTLAATDGGFWAAGSRARPSYEYRDLCWIDLGACYGIPEPTRAVAQRRRLRLDRGLHRLPP